MEGQVAVAAEPHVPRGLEVGLEQDGQDGLGLGGEAVMLNARADTRLEADVGNAAAGVVQVGDLERDDVHGHEAGGHQRAGGTRWATARLKEGLDQRRALVETLGVEGRAVEQDVGEVFGGAGGADLAGGGGVRGRGARRWRVGIQPKMRRQ